jgi:diadenosine tetraphosphate (Ap4A) HIT family hydrolase
MKKFQLDNRLTNDCYVVGKLTLSYLLIMNNNLLPWFILVPETDVTEFFQLEENDQLTLLSEINRLSQFVKLEFQCDKLNVATIGNIVEQLHIHVVGRNLSDYCWPGVVWGAEGKQPYDEDKIEKLGELIKAKLNCS